MKYGQVGGYGSVPKKKNGKKIVGIFLFFSILIIVGGFLYYKFVYSANTIKLLLNKTFDYLEDEVENSDYDSIINEFNVQINLQSDDYEENQLLNIFNKLEFSGNYGIDYDKNIMSFDIYSDYDEKDLFDINIYMEYGRAYFYLNGLYDKYIDSSVDNYSEFFERNLDEAKTIIVSIRKALDNSLKDEYFTVEKVKVDGENVTKTTLDLTDDNYENFINDIVKNLKNNKSFLESFSKLFDIKLEDIEKVFDDMIEESKDYKGEKYILYTKNFRFVMLEIIDDYDKVLVKDNDGRYEYKLYEEDSIVYSGYLDIIENKENEGKLKFYFYDADNKFGIETTVGVSVKKNAVVDRKDVSNSISYEKIDENDIISIYSKLIENEGAKKIIEELSTLFNGADNDNLSLSIS